MTQMEELINQSVYNYLRILINLSSRPIDLPSSAERRTDFIQNANRARSHKIKIRLTVFPDFKEFSWHASLECYQVIQLM